jgi:DNA primase
LGAHLSQLQLGQLCDQPDRQVFIAFDSDPNGAGQGAARFLAQRLTDAGLTAFIVNLPEGQDPNSYFVSGASAEEFRRCLEAAENRWP